ncbi:MAG: hypothetical protein ACLFPA_08915 [Dichotomicrobium sp.]
MTDEDKRKLREVQQNLADAARAIDAASINLQALVNASQRGAARRADNGTQDDRE